MNDIKVLIFDLDNTLINYGGVTQQAWSLSCAALAKKVTLPCSSQTLTQEIININDAIWTNEAKTPKGNFSFQDLRTSIVQQAFDNLHIDNNGMITLLVETYEYYKYKSIYMFPDVINTLQKLKQEGYMITLLTNGDTQTQREKLKRFALEPLFDHIFIGGEQGVDKPDVASYQHVLDTCHINASEACIIGDHYLWEVKVPKSYGLSAIWVNRTNSYVSTDEILKPDFIIENIDELLPIFIQK